MISTVCPYPYGSCKLIRKRQASLHDPDDVMRLIKRCHTVRSQFADELNQDIPFQGWPIGGFQHSWLTFKIKTMLFLHIYIYTRQRQALCSPCSYLISCSVFCLCSLFLLSSCFLASASLAVHPTPLLSTWGLQWWLQKAKFEVSCGCISLLCL